LKKVSIRANRNYLVLPVSLEADSTCNKCESLSRLTGSLQSGVIAISRLALSLPIGIFQ